MQRADHRSAGVPERLSRVGSWWTRPLGRVGSLYALAAALLVILNLADIAITREALAHGATEINPLAALFVGHGVAAYVIKLAVPIVVLLLACSRRAQARLSEGHIAVIWMIVGIYATVVFMNVVTWLTYV